MLPLLFKICRSLRLLDVTIVGVAAIKFDANMIDCAYRDHLINYFTAKSNDPASLLNSQSDSATLILNTCHFLFQVRLSLLQSKEFPEPISTKVPAFWAA
jgi:hypothetical protein